MSDEDHFTYGLGDTVAVGSREAIVRGQATFVFREDEYLLALLDEHGLPAEKWFAESQISAIRKH